MLVAEFSLGIDCKVTGRAPVKRRAGRAADGHLAGAGRAGLAGAMVGVRRTPPHRIGSSDLSGGGAAPGFSPARLGARNRGT